MQTALTVVTGATSTVVVVDADPQTPLADVEAAVAAVLPGGPLLLDGAPLPPHVPFGRCGLVDGTVLSRGAAVPSRPPVSAGLPELRVVGGPDAGQVFRLAAGTSVLGRGDDATLRLTDADLSRRHLAVHVEPGAVRIQDLGSSNGTAVDGRVLTGTDQPGLAVGALVRCGETRLVLAPPSTADAAVAPDAGGGLAFNRPPRIAPAARVVRVELPTPPTTSEPVRIPWLGVALPLVMGVVIAVVTSRPEFLLFSLLSPVLLLGNVVTDRRAGGRKARADRTAYDAAVQAAALQVHDARASDVVVRRAAGPDPAELLLVATGPGGRLWERRRHDPDALALRVGLADLPTEVEVVVPRGQDAPAAPLSPDVPVVLPLGDLGVVGVAGPVDRVRATARWLLAQAAVLHSPRDLQVVVLADGGAHEPDWGWVRWLPHARPDDAAEAWALAGTDAESTGRRIGELVALVEQRTAQSAERSAVLPPAVTRPVLVVLDGARALRRLPGVPLLLSAGPAVGVHLLCLDVDERSLPEECRAVVRYGAEPATRVVVRQPRVDPLPDVLADQVTAAWAEQVARALAPLRDASAEAGGGLPAAVRFVELAGLEPPTADAVLARWAATPASTRALVGVGAEGAFSLDLVTDGPHGLVAGTTGAGKSEFLQTLVASLAVVNRPDRMSFVLVDYKGGAAFKDCARLPHTVGMVTDLDGHLVERALASLGAELKRRESVLGRAGVKDLPDYERAGLPHGPLPRLLLVIDEFASMVEELPDFVRGLVGIAQRGRSLGVHLVLATQRPGGVVSPEIRANTNLRVALRVTDESESRDVVDAPDAGRIPRSVPGRGYARTGHTTLTAFQSARVGGRRPGASTTVAPPYAVVVPWSQVGRPPAARPAGTAAADDDATDLHALVEAVRDAAARTELPVLPPPWLPALPEVVALGDLPAAGPWVVPLGLADLPGEQRQAAFGLDLQAGGHLLVAGAARTGRTTLLRTLAGSLAGRFAVADVHVHAVDCGGGGLLPLAGLPHVGAVVTRDQPDRVARLLTRLLMEVARRQELLSAAGHGDVVEQRAAVAAEERLPYLVLLVDRWESFVQVFEDVEGGRAVEQLLRLLREGSAAGVRVVVTSDRSGLMGRVASLLEHRLVLRLSDRADAGLAGLSVRDLPETMPPGRGVLVEGAVETQVALLGGDPSGPAQVAALQAIAVAGVAGVVGAAGGAGSAEVPRAQRPFRVEPLPTRVLVSQVDRVPASSPTTVLLGLGGEDVEPVVVDLAEHGPGFLVAGPRRSGRSSALVVLAAQLLAQGCRVVAVCPRRSPLSEVSGVVSLAPADDAELRELVAVPGPLVVLVDDAEAMVDAAVGPVLEDLLRRGPGHGRAVVAAGLAEELTAQFRGFVLEVRKSRFGVLLNPSSPLEGDLVGLRLARPAGGQPAGRGLFASAGTALPLQVALPG